MPHKSPERGADWQLYAEHREEFTKAVLSLAPERLGRLCVLGAGKCNDLDLARVSRAFSEVHLVDLLPAALASAVSREDATVRERLKPHAPVDLAVMSDKRGAKWKRQPPPASEIEAAASHAKLAVLSRLPGPFDVVVSACVLTQLGFALTQTLGDAHASLAALRLATVRAHLQTLLELTAPGGKALFVSDLASSTHYALDTLPPDANLRDVLQDVLAKRAFYHVAHPQLIRDELTSEAPDRPVSELSPWLWTGPKSRTYLVYGYVLAAAA
ncbi:MAG TPA: hypothetical protein VHB79_36785 [Polyangiaceae bacterium]|nr:hypothetical protein [Polyangiaceae bacterium]